LQISQRYALAVRGVRPEALASLEAHSWPGNVRELETVLEEAMIFQSDGWIKREDLRFRSAREEQDLTATLRDGRTDIALEEPLTRCQREALRIAAQRGEVRRRDVIVRCQISRESARRELIGLSERGLLVRVGRGRGVRYVCQTTSQHGT